MCNKALSDPNLSLKAKGLWAFIMTKPDGWKINSRGLSTQLKEGREAIMSGLRELEENGYLTRGMVRQKDGRFVQGDSILYETPWSGNSTTENPTTKERTTKNNPMRKSVVNSTNRKPRICGQCKGQGWKPTPTNDLTKCDCDAGIVNG